ncbi:hypothetical protein ACWOBX_00660 [Facklamia languida]
MISLPTVPPSHAQKNGFKGPIKEDDELGGDTIAKDGTYRGGRRVKAGGKPQSAAEKIEKGKKVEILMNDIPTFTPEEIDAVDLPDGAVFDGTDMPT